jgi:hypothetical protein
MAVPLSVAAKDCQRPSLEPSCGGDGGAVKAPITGNRRTRSARELAERLVADEVKRGEPEPRRRLDIVLPAVDEERLA